VNASGKKLEIIFVSCDKSEAEFNEYYGTMPWLSIPHGDPKAHSVMTQFGIQGVPHLMILKKDGTAAIPNARGDV
jgi:nucleoredoxin